MVLFAQFLIISLFIFLNWDILTGSGDIPQFQNLSKLSIIVVVIGAVVFLSYFIVFNREYFQNRVAQSAKDKILADKTNLFRIISKKYPDINYHWIQVIVKEDHISFYDKTMQNELATIDLKQIKQVNSTQYFPKKGVIVRAAMMLVLDSGQKIILQHTKFNAMADIRNDIKTKWHKIKPHYDPVENPRTWSDRFNYMGERSRRRRKKQNNKPIYRTAFVSSLGSSRSFGYVEIFKDYISFDIHSGNFIKSQDVNYSKIRRIDCQHKSIYFRVYKNRRTPYLKRKKYNMNTIAGGAPKLFKIFAKTIKKWREINCTNYSCQGLYIDDHDPKKKQNPWLDSDGIYGGKCH